VADVLAFAADSEWSRYLPLPQPYSDADARSFVATQILQNKQEHPAWAIQHGNQVVGGINIRFFSEHRIGEIGYSISRPLWGRGLATEAARAVLKAAFETIPQLARVRAMADARNLASIRVFEKLGMKREGTLRSNRFLRGEAVDEVWCGLLRSEWQS
jgi:ribosomal-protein-alanine N-acetyltransferase